MINKFAEAFLLTFVDFNITFGASLTIGSGTDFEQKSQVVKIGTPDVPIDVNDTMVLTESTVWIWFQSYDPMVKLEDRIYNVGWKVLRYEQRRSVSGIQLQIASAGFNRGNLHCVNFNVNGEIIICASETGHYNNFCLFESDKTSPQCCDATNYLILK